MNDTLKQLILDSVIPAEFQGTRLDATLAKLFPDYSRECLKAWILKQHVTVNGQHLQPKTKVKGGEVVHIETSLEAFDEWQAEAIDLDILYEDESIVIINKPAGLVVHPATGNQQGTLLNALLHNIPDLIHLPRAGIVHRLDKDTSGVMVVAKTLAAHHKLVKLLQQRDIKREYRAIVYGAMTAGSTIKAPIGRHPNVRTKMAVIESGKPAITHYRVLERFYAHTYLRVMLETGRTHQIRVHMAHIGYPVVGDQTYARFAPPRNCSPELHDALSTFKRQALHSFKIGLKHPENGCEIEIEAPLPKDMEALLVVLENDRAARV